MLKPNGLTPVPDGPARLEEDLLRGEPLLRPLDKRLPVLTRNRSKLSLRARSMLAVPPLGLRQLLLHLVQPLAHRFRQLFTAPQPRHRQPAVRRRIRYYQILLVLTQLALQDLRNVLGSLHLARFQRRLDLRHQISEAGVDLELLLDLFVREPSARWQDRC